MYHDLRIRNANRPTPVPRTYKAYVFSCYPADCIVYKVIVAPSLVSAWSRIMTFSADNDLDVFWQFVCEDDFEMIYSNNVIPK